MPYNPYQLLTSPYTAAPQDDSLETLARIHALQQQSDALLGQDYHYPDYQQMQGQLQSLPTPPVRNASQELGDQRRGNLITALGGLLLGGIPGAGYAAGAASQSIPWQQDRLFGQQQDNYQNRLATGQAHNAIVRQRFADQIDEIKKRRERDLQQAGLLDRQAGRLQDDVDNADTRAIRREQLAGLTTDREGRQKILDAQLALKENAPKEKEFAQKQAYRQKQLEDLFRIGNDSPGNLKRANELIQALTPGATPITSLKKSQEMNPYQKESIAIQRARLGQQASIIAQQASLRNAQVDLVRAQIDKIRSGGGKTAAQKYSKTQTLLRLADNESANMGRIAAGIRTLEGNTKNGVEPPSLAGERDKLIKAQARYRRFMDGLVKEGIPEAAEPPVNPSDVVNGLGIFGGSGGHAAPPANQSLSHLSDDELFRMMATGK